jgi:hypothetical protein
MVLTDKVDNTISIARHQREKRNSHSSTTARLIAVGCIVALYWSGLSLADYRAQARIQGLVCQYTPWCHSPATQELAQLVFEPPAREPATVEGTGEEPKSNGRTKDVQWDRYSLILKGQRVFIQ